VSHLPEKPNCKRRRRRRRRRTLDLRRGYATSCPPRQVNDSNKGSNGPAEEEEEEEGLFKSNVVNEEDPSATVRSGPLGGCLHEHMVTPGWLPQSCMDSPRAPPTGGWWLRLPLFKP